MKRHMTVAIEPKLGQAISKIPEAIIHAGGKIYGIRNTTCHTCSFTIQGSEAVTRRCKHSAQDKDGPSTRAGPRNKLR